MILAKAHTHKGSRVIHPVLQFRLISHFISAVCQHWKMTDRNIIFMAMHICNGHVCTCCEDINELARHLCAVCDSLPVILHTFHTSTSLHSINAAVM